ncbi:MAG TPA: N-acetylglucosamine-6-phosphate deacetylase [Bacillales bacterium]|nr:N-acetylglucosamine-6-phosphate deacetylase [Bacillales bacterium]
MGNQSILIRDITVYGEDRIYESGSVRMKDGKIEALKARHEMGEPEPGEEIISLDPDYICIPGFIDVHIHGAAGADAMDGTPEALKTIAGALPAEGTTGFLATTMTQDGRLIEKALANAGNYWQDQSNSGCAEMLGIHLEGPFISPDRAGAQPVDHIMAPDSEQFRKWQEAASGHIRLVTLAPEQTGGLDLVRYLADHDVVASIGHSDATFEQVEGAIAAGASHVTHLYNGMRGLHHREPGVVGAALLKKELTAEMIVDGIHMRPEMVDLAYRQKKKSGLVLITDAIRAKCLRNGTYDLGGQDAIVKDGEAHLENGSLAGSMLKMKDAVQNVMAYTGCNLAEAVQMSAANPAKELKVFDRKGSIATGKDADLVVLDRDLNVVMTFCRGEIAYEREGVRR